MPLEFVNSLDLGSSAAPGEEKGTGPICRNGPEGASHKLDLSPFYRCRLLLLPATSGLSAAELDALRQYARRGGTLLLAGDVLRYDQQGREQREFALARELGLGYEGQSPSGGGATIAGRLGDGGPLSAAAVKGFIRVQPERGRTLLWLRQAGKEYPLLHVNELGRGRVAYLASLDSEALTLAAIRALAGPPPVEVQPPQCQVVLTEQAAEHRWVLHLISGGEYTVEIARSQVPAAKVSRQYPPTGWSYRLEPAPAGLRIHVGGQAQDRLLVLE